MWQRGIMQYETTKILGQKLPSQQSLSRVDTAKPSFLMQRQREKIEWYHLSPVSNQGLRKMPFEKLLVQIVLLNLFVHLTSPSKPNADITVSLSLSICYSPYSPGSHPCSSTPSTRVVNCVDVTMKFIIRI